MGFFRSLFIAITLFICCRASAAEFDPADLRRSVGQLHFSIKFDFFDKTIPIEAMTATAWAVNDHTLVTAAHVCSEAQTLGVDTRSLDIFKMDYIDANDERKVQEGIRVWRLDVINDLCVLWVKSHPLKPIEIEPDYKNNVHLFTKVHMVGAPKGVFPVMKDCVVVSKNGKEFKERFLDERLITSCEALPGFSGSPLVSDTGKVVGVIAGGFLKSEWDPLSFASYGASSFQILEILKGLK